MELVLKCLDSKGVVVYLTKEGFWTPNKSQAEVFQGEQDFYMESFYGTSMEWEDACASADPVKGELWIADAQTHVAIYCLNGEYTLYAGERAVHSSRCRDAVAALYRNIGKLTIGTAYRLDGWCFRTLDGCTVQSSCNNGKYWMSTWKPVKWLAASVEGLWALPEAGILSGAYIG